MSNKLTTEKVAQVLVFIKATNPCYLSESGIAFTDGFISGNQSIDFIKKSQHNKVVKELKDENNVLIEENKKLKLKIKKTKRGWFNI